MNKPKEDHNQKEDAPKEREAEQPDSGIQLSAEECKNLLAKVNELEALREKMLRGAADFENAKKRLVKEKEEYLKYAHENIISKLLPVLDNFERALAHANEENLENLKNVVKGIQMVFKQMQDSFKTSGLKRLQTVGEKFDPHLHEAVSFVKEEGEADVVVDEIQAGYQLHDKLIRAAKVRVRMHPEPDHSSSPDAQEEKNEELT